MAEPVGIVGAGIAGLTFAAALHRRSVPATVYEQAPSFGEVGAGLQLAPNATRLLYRLGLGAFLNRVGVRPQAMEMRHWAEGNVLARTELGASCESEFGAPYLTVHRADLHRGLLSVFPGKIRHGVHCTGVADHADGVVLRFDDGSTAEAGVVAGADGVRSIVRRSFLQDSPRYAGQAIYRGIVPAEAVPELAADPKVLLWLGPGQHAVCYPIASGRLVSFGATVRQPEWHLESWSEAGSSADLLLAYQGWHSDLHKVLKAAEGVSRWALHDRDPVEVWHTGRITLVGDAAHPMLPFVAQGANQAIEDAIVLAACLADQPPEKALRRYEQLRRPRATEVQRISRHNARALHDGSRPDAEQQRAQQKWLFGHDAGKV